MKKLMVSAALLAAWTVQASVQQVTLWRGETSAFELIDQAELEPLLEEAAALPLKIRVGSALPVKYLTVSYGNQYATALDRVVWGDHSSPHRWAEVTVPETVKAGVYKAGMLEVTVLDKVLPPASE